MYYIKIWHWMLQ